LSIANQRRQRGSEERNSDLLIELDPGDSREIDMVIASEQCDQNQQQAGGDRDPALKIKSEKNHSQNRSPEPPSGVSGRPATTIRQARRLYASTVQAEAERRGPHP
jgi:hypothetical protein